MSFTDYTGTPVSSDYRKNMIPFVITGADDASISAFVDLNGVDANTYMAILHRRLAKASFNPQWAREAFYVSVTFRDEAHALHGKTINVGDVDTDIALVVAAWLAETCYAIPVGLLNDFLNLGSGAFRNAPLDSPKLADDDEIPF